MLEQLTLHLDTFGAAAAGALLGSLSAFALGLLTDRLRRRDDRYAALLASQYALISQWTIIESIRRDLLERWRDDPLRFTKLIIYHAPGVAAKVPFDDITFITMTPDADLLQQVHLAEQKYFACIETLRLRNERLGAFYDDPSVVRQNFDFETGRSLLTADPRKLFLVRRLTDALYEHVDSALPKLIGEIEALEKFIKRRFRGKTALKMIGKDEKPIPRWKRRLRSLLRISTWVRIFLFVAMCCVIVLSYHVVELTIDRSLTANFISIISVALILIFWRVVDRLFED